MKFFKKTKWLRYAQKTGKFYKDEKYDEALECAEIALKMAEEAFGPKHINVNRTLFNLVVVHRELKQYNKAVEYGIRALAITEENRGADDISVVDDLKNLLAVYEEMGNEQESIKIRERIEAINKEN